MVHTCAWPIAQLTEISSSWCSGALVPSGCCWLSLSVLRRGQHLDGAEAARAAVAEAHAAGGKIAAFFCESIPSCAGQVIFPPGYLRDAYAVMHEEGALCIADEVRLGGSRGGTALL